MDTQSKLVELLERLNSGESVEEVKYDAQEFLASVDPKELSLAEQKLVAHGMSLEDIQRLCGLHIDLLQQQLEDIRRQLPSGHVLHTLMAEHDLILGFLDELEKTNAEIQKMDESDADPSGQAFQRLDHIAEHLVETELHHQREEDVLFPEMESRGVSAPARVMQAEHTELRGRKKRLKELAEGVGEMDFDKLKSELDALCGYIIPHLREHIFKENNILYPTALQLVAETDTWDEMKKRCDEIGYCCFTPEV